jgi:serine/threonine-protein kinase
VAVQIAPVVTTQTAAEAESIDAQPVKPSTGEASAVVSPAPAEAASVEAAVTSAVAPDVLEAPASELSEPAQHPSETALIAPGEQALELTPAEPATSVPSTPAEPASVIPQAHEPAAAPLAEQGTAVPMAADDTSAPLSAVPSAGDTTQVAKPVVDGKSLGVPRVQIVTPQATVGTDAAQPDVVRPPQAAATEVVPSGIAVPETSSQQLALGPVTDLPEDPTERMRHFLKTYNGGTCFFALPRELTGSHPRIEGYGTALEPFKAFGAAFRKAFGVEADIGVKEITDNQCPAIGLIGGLLGSSFPELAFEVDDGPIASGGVLRGHIAGSRLPWFSLLLVDDDGFVHDVSSYIKQSESGLSFAVPVYLTSHGKGRNQLIVGIASERELAILNIEKPVRSDSLFPAVVRDASKTGNKVTIGIAAFVLN